MSIPLKGPKSTVSCLFITIHSEPQQNQPGLIGITAGDKRGPFHLLQLNKAAFSSPGCMLGLCFGRRGMLPLPREGFLLYITVLTLVARV